ncbi:methyltransferase type 12 [Betaproteobacteria bacterium GR16-43]|nr:methyltransferase type 12 [Betaproteobacteria bacterium GR16-43]
MSDPVRSQYEALPYPTRDPAEEKQRLLRTWLDDLPMISHYGFGGRAPFGKGFRALVAGGGTGDATVYLAEQLRATDAEIVHLDFSRTSLELARRRVEARGLANVRFVHESLLDLPKLDLGRFHYINSVGVLHHLPDPDEGLRALLGSLDEGGAMGLMVYGTVGRAGVYQMQSLMRLAIGEEGELRKRIAAAKDLLGVVPASNWFMRGGDLYSDHRVSDAGLVDLLLHPQDRGYTVEELFAWLEDGHGLHLELTDVQNGRSAYLPHLRMGPKPPKLVERIRAMPLRRQCAIGELLTGKIQTHSFYATRTPSAARYGDVDLVPFFFHEPLDGAQLARFLASGRGQPVVLDHRYTGLSVTVSPGRHGPAIVQQIDGKRSWREIFEVVRAGGASASDEEFFRDFAPVYEVLNSIDRVLLKQSAKSD